MGLYIVTDSEKAHASAIEAVVTLDGVVLIDLGETPDPKLEKEVGKIAEKFDYNHPHTFYIVKQKDHFLALWSLGQLFVDVSIKRSDIGKLNAYKLAQMDAATIVE